MWSIFLFFTTNIIFLVEATNVTDDFKRLDKDGDGSINFNDFLSRDPEYTSIQQAEFNKMDANGDGKVTQDEYTNRQIQLQDEAHARQLEYANLTLINFDLNKDHLLNTTELEDYIKSMYRDPKPLPSILPRYDKNNDTKLDLEEFYNFEYNFPYNDFPYDFTQLNIPHMNVAVGTENVTKKNTSG